MNKYRAIEYDIVLAFKRNNDSASVLRALRDALAKYTGNVYDRMPLEDIAFMVSSTVGALELVSGESNMVRWFNDLRWIQELINPDAVQNLLREFNLNYSGTNEMYIRHIFSFSTKLRLLEVSRMEGLAEHFQACTNS